ncbi:Cindoxin [Pseudomonas oleovorans subsp. oleovorans]|uniref:Putative FMN-binding protein n=1 Tax=Ectopseudomonas oleovorans TaxID=301 RepID=A0A379JQF6_ECTOL|nr:flavodoxin domain-containing protein [Pseudomonas oleovorans]OWK44209.1 Cindoxin [Pseudomonas oleovorans subsp. oleovorans]SEJ12194.1 MioC protein [Pseudomonas oleovorans]SUD50728.1 putative FMN-binding protein [Pseudomonas oleovorans]
MKIQVLYGTETGNAEMVAEDIVDALAAQTDIEAFDMSKIAASDLDLATFYIVVCSTYGDGELPNSAQPFYQALGEQRPNLNGLRFATFGLGDSFYTTYNNGSQIIAERLLELGAQAIGERGLHDASSGLLPGDVAVQWAQQLIEGLQA